MVLVDEAEGTVDELVDELVDEPVGGGVVAGVVVTGVVVTGVVVTGVVATVVDAFVVAGATELVAGTASPPSEQEATDSAAADIVATSAANRNPERNDLEPIEVVMPSWCAKAAAVPTDRGPDPRS